MKFRSTLRVVLAAATFATTSIAMAGGPDIAPIDPTQDAIHAYVSASAYFGDNPRIVTGFENDTNIHLSTNLNQKTDEETFIPEIGLWFPIWSNHENMIFNFVTFANWIPGTGKVTSRGEDQVEDEVETFNVALHHSMMNIGVGVNFLHYFAERWFGLLMVGGGVNDTNLHGDFDSFDPASDHDGTTGTSSIYRPFATIKLGLGLNVSEKSQVLVFGRYTSVNSRELFVSDNLDDTETSHILVGLPDSWWEVGVQFTRTFSL